MTTAAHGASCDRTNTHQLFYRDGLRHPFVVKRGAQINAARLNFDAVLEKSIQDALLVHAAERRLTITNEHTYQVRINGRSYWYTGVWWARGENLTRRLAWPDDEMETVEL